MSKGLLNVAPVPVPSAEPGVPTGDPANVVTVPSVATFLITLFTESVIKTFPKESKAVFIGVLSFGSVISPEKVVTTPDDVIFLILLFPESAT